MIIRSQNKKRIANLKNITEIVCNQGFEILVYFASDIGYSEIFGEYSTEEKAIKVLDMIQSAYEDASFASSWSGFVASTSFQMPQDSEV